MKKTVFSICSILTVVALIIMSCEKKEDPNMKKVYYNTQTGYSTGGNPNPTGQATSGGSATTGGTSSSGTASSSSGTSSTGTSSTTGGGCTDAMTVNSINCAPTNTNAGAAPNYRLVHSGGCIQIQITFSSPSAPTSGTYQIVSGTPGAGQCNFYDVNNATGATGGTVTILTGTPNKATYSNVAVGAFTATGTCCY